MRDALSTGPEGRRRETHTHVGDFCLYGCQFVGIMFVVGFCFVFYFLFLFSNRSLMARAYTHSYTHTHTNAFTYHVTGLFRFGPRFFFNACVYEFSTPPRFLPPVRPRQAHVHLRLHCRAPIRYIIPARIVFGNESVEGSWHYISNKVFNIYSTSRLITICIYIYKPVVYNVMRVQLTIVPMMMLNS